MSVSISQLILVNSGLHTYGLRVLELDIYNGISCLALACSVTGFPVVRFCTVSKNNFSFDI